MGRIYHQVTERGADGSRYTSEAFTRAISDVKDKKKTLKDTAKACINPRTTLRHRLNGTRSWGNCWWRNTDIPFELEKRLVDSLKVLEKWSFGLTILEVSDIVQIYVNSGNQLKT
ncbi:hypothetical protein JTB14_011715 [Gonioctena quinquepunctata]|nr:hypothetical protein JTB14_011715 [Gonioctena quinquepunctata]